MAKKILFQYDQAGLLLVNPATRVTERRSKGIHFTDSVQVSLSHGENFIVADRDGHLALYTHDLVLLKKVDLGYWANLWGAWDDQRIVNGFLYTLGSRQHAGETVPLIDKDQLEIRKWDPETLELVGEAPLTDPLLWDSVGHTPLVVRGSRNKVWTSTGVWIRETSGTVWHKVDLDTGAVLDTWATGPLDVSWYNRAGTVALSTEGGFINGGVLAAARYDFTTKTRIALNLDFLAAGVAAGIWADNGIDIGNVEVGIDGTLRLEDSRWRPLINESTNEVTFVSGRRMTDGVAPQAEYNQWAIGTLNLLTGAITYSSTVLKQLGPIPHLDLGYSGQAAVYPYDQTAWFSVVLSPTTAIIWATNQGVYDLDFNNSGAISGWALEEQTNGYSSDGYSIAVAIAYDIPEYPITGRVSKNAVNANGRKVFVYDQATGEKITEGVSNSDGVYTIKKFTARPAFGVSESTGLVEHYLARSGWTIQV